MALRIGGVALGFDDCVTLGLEDCVAKLEALGRWVTFVGEWGRGTSGLGQTAQRANVWSGATPAAFPFWRRFRPNPVDTLDGQLYGKEPKERWSAGVAEPGDLGGLRVAKVNAKKEKQITKASHGQSRLLQHSKRIKYTVGAVIR